jgi:hypothetical protein
MVIPIDRHKKLLLFVLWLFMPLVEIVAQEDSTLKFSFNGYLETYYLSDFSNSEISDRPSFYVSHHRQNEFNLNIGMFRLAAENKKFKAAFGIMTGSYVNANMEHELGLTKNIYEANINISINKNKELWLLAGIFNSHIGFESAIGADCYTLTRSIVADNSPYYESGLRLNYKKKDAKWEFNLLLLNGWQNIQIRKMNTMPSLGTQVNYNFKKIIFNSSNYFGNEGTNSSPVWRYYHNFYLIKNIANKSKIILGLDLGLQQKFKAKLLFWHSPQLVYSYRITKKVDLSGRIEHFFDPDAVITLPFKEAKLNVIGMSINLDYKLWTNLLFRLEFKQLNNSDEIFIKNKRLSHYNSSVAGAISLRF